LGEVHHSKISGSDQEGSFFAKFKNMNLQSEIHDEILEEVCSDIEQLKQTDSNLIMTSEPSFQDTSSNIIFNTSYTTNNSKQPKIKNKLDRQKFEFIYKRSVFRHFSGYYKHKFTDFCGQKKVHQNKLRVKTEEYIRQSFPLQMSDCQVKCIIAIIHQNKYNNALFEDLSQYFDLIRKVSHHYSLEAETKFFECPEMANVFQHFGQLMAQSSEIMDYIEF
jgi:hypothetical protein